MIKIFFFFFNSIISAPLVQKLQNDKHAHCLVFESFPIRYIVEKLSKCFFFSEFGIALQSVIFCLQRDEHFENFVISDNLFFGMSISFFFPSFSLMIPNEYQKLTQKKKEKEVSHIFLYRITPPCKDHFLQECPKYFTMQKYHLSKILI